MERVIIDTEPTLIKEEFCYGYKEILSFCIHGDPDILFIMTNRYSTVRTAGRKHTDVRKF